MARIRLTCILIFCVTLSFVEVLGTDKNVVRKSAAPLHDKIRDTQAGVNSTVITEEPGETTTTGIILDEDDSESTTPFVVPAYNQTDANATYEKFPRVTTLMDDYDSKPTNYTGDYASIPRAFCECGRSSQRIVGGDPADISDYPWTATLTRGSSRPYCGGTLINSKYVLTASHCVDGMSASGIRVVLYQESLGDQTRVQRFQVSSIRMHPNYDRKTVNNDIAILKIDPPVEFGRTNPIVPACVVGSIDTDFTGALATVLGFGATQQGGPTSTILRKVTIQVLSNYDCNQSRYAGKITSNMICAGDLISGGKDSCQGDSGGPLVIENGGRRTLIGIVSWGYGCAQPNSPGVYTRVSNYGDFILANTRDAEWCDN